MSETAKRITSGLTIGAIVIVALAFPGFYYSIFTLFLVLLFTLLGVAEYYSLTDKGLEGRAMKGIGLVFTVLFVILFYIQYLTIRSAAGHPVPGWLTPDVAKAGQNSFTLLLALFLILTMSAHLIRRPLDGSIYGVSTTMFGVLYCCIPFCHVFLMLAHEKGVYLFVLTALATIMTDAGAYFAGKFFGKHNAGLKVSPRKTYEGYVGGFLFSIAFNVGFTYFWRQYAFPPVNDVNFGYLEVVVFTGVLSVISVFGDLVESAMKRDAKKKDSASLIPGHGGMLDLADALYFTIPLGYYYMYFRQMAGYNL